MEIEDDFYATIKLNSGEEIFAKIAPLEEENRTLLLVSNPITITEIQSRNGMTGYKVERWLKTTSDDMFIIKLDDVITMSESSDLQMIKMYQSYVRQSDKEQNDQSKITRKMGYIANVNDAKEILEKLYNIS